MNERGNKIARMLDYWLGIPLVNSLGFLRPQPGSRVGCPRRIAVLCFAAIGDLLLLSGLINGIRECCPHSHITLITSRDNAGAIPLLRGLDSHAVFPIRQTMGLIRYLRDTKFDLLIDSTQWARVGSLVSVLSNARRSVGFSTRGQHRGHVYTHRVEHRADRHEVENFLALGRALWPDLRGEPTLVVPDTCPMPDFCLPPLEQGRPFVILHMWASGSKRALKQWPGEHWAKTAQELTAADYHVVFSGSRADSVPTQHFMDEWLAHEQGRRVHSVAGKTDLPTMAWLLRQAQAAVCVNTGIVHLAALCGAPTVSLHGGTSPLRWGPIGPRVHDLLPEKGDVAYLNLGFESPPGVEPSLPFLSVQAVLEALRGFGVRV